MGWDHGQWRNVGGRCCGCPGRRLRASSQCPAGADQGGPALPCAGHLQTLPTSNKQHGHHTHRRTRPVSWGGRPRAGSKEGKAGLGAQPPPFRLLKGGVLVITSHMRTPRPQTSAALVRSPWLTTSGAM